MEAPDITTLRCCNTNKTQTSTRLMCLWEREASKAFLIPVTIKAEPESIPNGNIIYTNHDYKKPLNCLHHFLMERNHYYIPLEEEK